MQRSRQLLRILGTAQLCKPYGVMKSSVGTSSRVVGRFLIAARGLGFSAFDTAPTYERAEEHLGKNLSNVSIHTKLDPSISVEDSIKGSLQRLQRSRIDVAYLHDPLAPLTDNGRAISEAARFVGQYFESLGTSVYSLEAMAASLARPEVQVIQIPVNPLWRELSDALPGSLPNRPLIFGRSLLAQGILAMDSARLPISVSHLRPFVQAFEEACRRMGRTQLESALLWSRDLEGLDGHIIGATSVRQLQEIASILDGPPLSPDERALIDAIPVPDSALFDPRSWN